MKKRRALLGIFLCVMLLTGLLPAAYAETEESLTPRQAFIEDILALARELYDKADGKPQRAHYKGDIYVCKNFTVYLFEQNAGKYRMAEYPDVPLVIPANLPKEECKTFNYGIAWKDIPASKGNPFVLVDRFLYDKNESKAENLARAIEFLKQLKRGDYYQVYSVTDYGTGPHSLVISADYDLENDIVTWCDSNFKFVKRNGIRYGYVQYDTTATAEWFAGQMLYRKAGASIYRLRDDIIEK